MNATNAAQRFQTTNWTRIARCRADPAALEALLTQYWSPVYAQLRRRGHPPQDAADLTQAFLSEVVVGRDLVGRADASRGRFRTYLLAALGRFVIDQHRRVCGRSGRPRLRFIPDDPDALQAAEPQATDDPVQAFDRQWATTLLSQAVDRARQGCQAEGLDQHWRAFEARVLRPITHGGEPEPIASIARRLGVEHPPRVSAMIQTVKRRIQRELVAEVRATVEDPADAGRELADLAQFLGPPPGH